MKDLSKSALIDIPLKQKESNYADEIIKYMESNSSFKEKVINKAKNFISEDKNEKG